MHPQLAKDRIFHDMFLDEARLSARIRHPNVVPTIDVVSEGGHLLLVMEYVEGESLASLARLHRSKGGVPNGHCLRHRPRRAGGSARRSRDDG